MAANRSVNTCGSVSSDGPVSKVNPSRRYSPSLPPCGGGALVQRHPVAERGEPRGGGQAPDARADHDDARHVSARPR